MRYGNIYNRSIITTNVFFLIIFIGFSMLYAQQKELTPLPIVKNGERVSFNFVDVELPALAKFMSDITRKNIIFDNTFKGKITIVAPEPLNRKEAFRLFSSILELKQYTLIESGKNTYKIVSIKTAREKGVPIFPVARKTVDETYTARLIQIKHVSVGEAIQFLRPLVSKNGYIKEFGPRNLLLIMDTGPNVDRVLDVMLMLDTPSETSYPEIVTLNYASAKTVAEIINEGLKGGSIASTQVKISALKKGKVYVVADTRLNGIIIFGPTQQRQSVRNLIALLDSPTPDAQGNINVYFLENADAIELAAVLEKLVNKSSHTGKSNKKPTNEAIKQKPFKQAGDIFITPDESTNSLLIVAPPSDYRALLEVIKKLDRRRKQVFVEAMIMEVSVDGIIELGTKWRTMAKNDGEPMFITGVGNIDASSVEQIIYGLGGLSIGGMGNFMDITYTSTNSDGTTSTYTMTAPGYAALFNAQEFDGVLNVLSTPQILTSDNQEAEIVVGENVPFITKRESDSSRDTSVFSTIERKDVGIKLKITPQITEGDYIKMDIYQEISNVKDQSTEILITVGPTTTKRSTKTSVIVKDKHTVVIGGLIEEKQYESVTKVPLLGDIPVVGWLFKTKGNEKEKINLMVFLTPYIVEDADTLNALTRRKYEKVRKRTLEEEKNLYDKSSDRYDRGEFEDTDLEEEKEYYNKRNKPAYKRTYNYETKPTDRLLVEFVEGVSNKTALRIIENAGTVVISKYGAREFYLVQLKNGVRLIDAQGSLESHPEVRVAEPQTKMR